MGSHKVVREKNYHLKLQTINASEICEKFEFSTPVHNNVNKANWVSYT